MNNTMPMTMLAMLVALVLPASSARAADATFTIAKTPAWVNQVTAAQLPAPISGLGSLQFVLSDEQANVGKDGSLQEYHHEAKQVSAASGLNFAGKVAVSYRPESEQLVFHSLRIVRLGQIIPLLRQDMFTVLRRETGLNQLMYDGEQTLITEIPGIRVGDLIEWEYSRIRAPAFGGNVSLYIPLADTAPAAKLSIRILWPKALPLAVKGHRTTLAPIKTPFSATQDQYLINKSDLSAVVLEPHTPAAYDVIPWLEFSSFSAWSKVVDALAPYYRDLPPSAALRTEIASLREAGRSPEDLLINAARYVQDEVRYVGFEIGAGAFAPRSANYTFEQRYGDCKDKSLLLVTMLHELGIQAEVMLVHTKRGALLPTMLPSPYHFNHAIVHATIAGRSYIFDATATGDRQSLALHAASPYAFGLPIKSGTAQLLPLTAPKLDNIAEDFTEEFFADDPKTPARLVVTMVYVGAAADALRNTLAASGNDALTRNFVDYYSGRFPHIKVLTETQIADDQNTDTLRTTATYAIPAFWTVNRERDLLQTQMSAASLGAYMTPLGNFNRSAPLALQDPAYIRHTTIVHLPSPLYSDTDDESVESRFFVFKSSVTGGAKTFKQVATWQSRASVVAPADFKRYSRDLDRVARMAGRSISIPLPRGFTDDSVEGEPAAQPAEGDESFVGPPAPRKPLFASGALRIGLQYRLDLGGLAGEVGYVGANGAFVTGLYSAGNSTSDGFTWERSTYGLHAGGDFDAPCLGGTLSESCALRVMIGLEKSTYTGTFSGGFAGDTLKIDTANAVAAVGYVVHFSPVLYGNASIGWSHRVAITTALANYSPAAGDKAFAELG